MSNFIIKPDGLFPSTYSQMGRVLIPSEKCNNRKIARKYDEKGSTSVLNTQTGIKTLSAPYISTFKQFDRPGPLISEECQPCRIVSVPSVTDKTVYPCSSGKYSVTGYVDTSNKIGVLGNSMFPRITTSDYQLYQQYRDVTEKKNIVEDTCPCPFTLESGIYIDFTGTSLTFFPIIYKDCKFCFETISKYLQTYTNVVEIKSQQINDCQYDLIVKLTGSTEPQRDKINIIDNNKWQLIINETKISYILETPKSGTLTNQQNLDEITLTGDCGTIKITELESNNNIISFKEDGKLKSFSEFIETGPPFNRIYLIDGDNIYVLSLQTTIEIEYKITCDCFYSYVLSPQTQFFDHYFKF